MKLIQTLIFSIACAFCLSAAAQWQWVDRDGQRVFSDRAPPADIPEANILKRPRQTGKSTGAPAAIPVPDTSAAPKPTGADKELLEKKKLADKQASDAQAAKRKAEDERIATLQAENCARARQAKTGLDSGIRIARANDKGEREFLDDAARAEEARRTQDVIDKDCK